MLSFIDICLSIWLRLIRSFLQNWKVFPQKNKMTSKSIPFYGFQTWKILWKFYRNEKFIPNERIEQIEKGSYRKAWKYRENKLLPDIFDGVCQLRNRHFANSLLFIRWKWSERTEKVTTAINVGQIEIFPVTFHFFLFRCNITVAIVTSDFVFFFSVVVKVKNTNDEWKREEWMNKSTEKMAKWKECDDKGRTGKNKIKIKLHKHFFFVLSFFFLSVPLVFCIISHCVLISFSVRHNKITRKKNEALRHKRKLIFHAFYFRICHGRARIHRCRHHRECSSISSLGKPENSIQHQQKKDECDKLNIRGIYTQRASFVFFISFRFSLTFSVFILSLTLMVFYSHKTLIAYATHSHNK